MNASTVALLLVAAVIEKLRAVGVEEVSFTLIGHKEPAWRITL